MAVMKTVRVVTRREEGEVGEWKEDQVEGGVRQDRAVLTLVRVALPCRIMRMNTKGILTLNALFLGYGDRYLGLQELSFRQMSRYQGQGRQPTLGQGLGMCCKSKGRKTLELVTQDKLALEVGRIGQIRARVCSLGLVQNQLRMESLGFRTRF